MQELKCGICNLEFKTRSGRWKHIKNKHDKIEVIIFKCKYCNKKLSDRFSKWKHETKVCKKNNNLNSKNKKNEEVNEHEDVKEHEEKKENKAYKLHSNINKKLDEIKQTIIQSVPINNQLVEIIVNKNKIIENLTKTNLENELNVNNIDNVNNINNIDNNDIIKNKEEEIKILKNLVLKKQKRVQYNDKYVIYMLTTLEHKKNNVYIIGKAINLTNRLSTYNKTTEHLVVYYKGCNKDTLKIIEDMVLYKLHDYKEQANRDRFILPVDKNINFFTEVINDCINFFNK